MSYLTLVLEFQLEMQRWTDRITCCPHDFQFIFQNLLPLLFFEQALNILVNSLFFIPQLSEQIASGPVTTGSSICFWASAAVSEDGAVVLR